MPLRSVNAGGVFIYDRTIRTQVRTESPLRFIVWDTRLVFDAANPSVFANYVEASQAAAAAASAKEKDNRDFSETLGQKQPPVATEADSALAEELSAMTTKEPVTQPVDPPTRGRVRFFT
jgi:hypothetical protein